MDLHSLGEYGNDIALIGGGAAALAAFMRWGWPIIACAWKRATTVWHNLETFPAKLAELRADGEARGNTLGEAIGKVDRKVDSLQNTQRAALNTNARVAVFEADELGRCTVVNRTYLRWSGLAPSELLGWGWLNAIHADDREKVRAAWMSCVADCRRFECRYRMIDASGKDFDVDVSADPIPEGAAVAERWYGQVYQVAARASAAA